MNQRERILSDLLQGLEVNMLKDIQRYGTSCRSRIAELRAEGYPIEDKIIPPTNYKTYFLPAKFLKEHYADNEVA